MRRGRKARGLRLGDGSAAGLLTTTSRNHAHARRHLPLRPPARRHPGAGADGRAGVRRRRALRAALRADRARRHRRRRQHGHDVPRRRRQLRERPRRRRRAEQQRLRHGAASTSTPMPARSTPRRPPSTLPAGATVLWAGSTRGADTERGANGAAAPSAAAARSPAAGRRLPADHRRRRPTSSSSSLAGDPLPRLRDVTAPVAAGGSGTYSVGDVLAGTRRRTASPAGRCSSPTATTRSRSGA